ncbi:MAG: hypothetical protein E7587_02645 [Ruminococcaceae bacterium]|nr:hypothetical protein [Oscillospiraceae bacterium]
MLHIVKGDIGSGKTTYLAALAKDAVLQKKHCYIIVPEQQTVATEKFMAEHLPSSAPLYSEVTNFSRLANTVFRKYGGISYKYSSEATRSLIMWKTLGELLPLLNEKSDKVEFGRVKKMLSALSELHACSVSPKMLSDAALLSEDASLKDKLGDLAMISELYSSLLKEHYSDQSEDLDKLYDILSENSFFENSCVLVDSFTSFTVQEYKVLSLIMKQCDLTVTLSLPPMSEERACFEETQNCEKKLIMYASSRSVDIKFTELGNSKRNISPLMQYVAKNMTSPVCSSLPSYDGDVCGSDSLRIVRCPEPYSEAEFIALDIQRQVQNGAKYSDFSIFARSASAYEGIIDTALQKYNIPFFMSVRTDISSLSPIRMIYAAYAVCIKSFNRSDVITYMKCGLAGIDEKDCDDFEIYTKKWNINGKRFYDGIDWNMNPRGYEVKRSDDGGDFLVRINETRRKLIEPLEDFYEFLSQKHTVSEHCERLFRFLQSVSLEDRLDELATQAELEGEQADADIFRRLYSVICASLDRLYETLADTEVNAEHFVQLLRITFGETDIGQIPASFDAVTVGSADMLRASCEHIYLMGVNEGEFPASVTESSAFSQSDREALSELGLDLEQDLGEQASRELFCIYRAFSSAEKTVTLLYTDTSVSYSASKPSYVLENIKHLAGEYARYISYTELSDKDKIWARDAAFEMIGELSEKESESALFEIFSEDPEYARRLLSVKKSLYSNKESLSDNIMKNLLPSDISISPSRIESYVKCHFGYFCRYIMRLNGHEDIKIDVRGIGNFVHAILERLFSYLSSEGKRITDLDKNETLSAVKDITAKYIEDISPDGSEHTPRMKHLFDRLYNAVLLLVKNLQKEFSQSEFTPRFFEFQITEKDANAPSPIKFTAQSGTRIALYGNIDRVDTYESNGNVYVRVVDYKTGGKSFSLDSIEYGLNMQMLIYLFSIWKTENKAFKERIGCKEGGEIIPAGILYFNANVKDSEVSTPSEDEINKVLDEKFKRNGLLLNDESILRAMDRNLDSGYIPVKLSKKGELTPAKALASLEDMGNILKKIENVLGNICEELQGGNMHASPLKAPSLTSPCTYCEYNSICRNKVEKLKF